MKRQKLITALVVAATLCACTPTNHKTSHTGIPTLEIPSDRKDAPAMFDSLFAYSHHIILETNDSSLIGRIEKIKIHNDRMYIQDRQTRRIVVFDTLGNYLTHYNRLGQGPEEYQRLTDFDIRNDSLFLLDGLSGKLLTYRLPEGTFLCSEKIDKAEGFASLGNRRYALNIGNGYNSKGNRKNYMSYAVSQDGQIVMQDIPYNKELCGLSFSFEYGNNIFFHYDDSLYTVFSFNDTIYAVRPEDGSLTPAIALQIEERQITPEDDRQAVQELLKKNHASLFGFYKWGDCYMVSYLQPSKGIRTVVARFNGEILFCGSFGIDRNKLPMHFAPYESDKGNSQVLSVLLPMELLPMVKRYGNESNLLRDIAARLTEESNPVLVFYDFRKLHR